MKTIREIFKSNVIALRGNRRLKEVAKGAGIPYRTYQNIEEGVIPQDETLQKLAEYFEVPEGKLFFDTELSPKAGQLKELVTLLSALNESEITAEIEVLRGLVEARNYESPQFPHRDRKLKQKKTHPSNR